MNNEIQFILYQLPDEEGKVQVVIKDETIWATQKAIAQLFGVDKSGVSRHIANIYKDGELQQETTVAKIATVVNRGIRGEVEEKIDFYNLDIIIAVGYRVSSARATKFRQWATKVLNEYIKKGFALDEERLKQGTIMSAYIYAIIPYKSGIAFNLEEISPCAWGVVPTELKNIDSEFTDSEGIVLFSDFLMINTCYRQSAFANNKDGYSWIRADICRIARALGAKEVWYVEELITDWMDGWDFSFEDWVESLRNEKKHLVAELTVDLLKGNYIYSYYHDDFSDIIMEKQ